MKILIDADGCPVVDETVTLCRKYQLSCLILCDMAHQIEREGAETILVSVGRDMVDFELINKVSSGDIVVTQDYGLAAMVLAKNAYAINQNGLWFTEENIDSLLFTRHVHREQRLAGKRGPNQPKRKHSQNRAFFRSLEKLIKQQLPQQQ